MEGGEERREKRGQEEKRGRITEGGTLREGKRVMGKRV